jgi:hypothetical protein
MILAVVSMAFGLCSQLPIFRAPVTQETAPIRWASGYSPGYFTAKWQVLDAHDVPTEQFKFTPRYSYSGVLEGSIEGNELKMVGDMTASDINNGQKLGTAKFTVQGPISNTQVAGHFTYIRRDVDGFGTVFMEFDSAGNGTLYMIVRVTSPKQEEGDVAMVVMHLHRLV